MSSHRIVFDDQIFHMQPYGGISRYVCELASRLTDTPDLQARVIAPLHVNAYLAASGVSQWGLHLPLRFRGEGRLCSSVNRVLMPALLMLAAPDLIHLTYYPPKLAATTWPSRVPRVVTVYDMIHELLPETFQDGDPTAARKRHAVQCADHVICISQHTANDLVRLLGVPASRITVIPLGFSAEFGSIDTASRAHAIKVAATSQPLAHVGSGRPYLLYVGARPGHKNFRRLLQAYGGSARLQQAFDLRAFGGGPFSREEQEAAREAGVADGRLQWCGGGDAELARAYRDATAFIYPSLYEGFGIPPLEAMSSGCPVVCSNTSSIPEVVGAAGAYFAPENVDDIRAVVESIVFDPARREALKTAGAIRCQEFSWDRCAESTASVYRSLLGAPT